MVYTETKQKNRKKYYYRVRSLRTGKKFKKDRIYLGVNLSNQILSQKEEDADKKLIESKINRALMKIKPKIIEVLKKYKIKKAGISHIVEIKLVVLVGVTMDCQAHFILKDFKNQPG